MMINVHKDARYRNKFLNYYRDLFCPVSSSSKYSKMNPKTPKIMIPAFSVNK